MTILAPFQPVQIKLGNKRGLIIAVVIRGSQNTDVKYMVRYESNGDYLTLEMDKREFQLIGEGAKLNVGFKYAKD